VVLADSIGPIVDAIFRDGPAGSAAAWLGVWLFTFQIYFDFSGYSDIAVGSAYLFGIRLPRNFATPFLAPDIAQFWQRWHMTLTSYLRDYVFVPLADVRMVSRRFRIPQYFFAMTLTMALCGLWHGANFTFVLWGALQGIAIVVATMWPRYFRSPPALTCWAATFAFCVATAVFFRAPSLGYAFDYLRMMFSLGSGFSAVAAQPVSGWELPGGGVSALLIVTGCLALLALHWLEARVTTLQAAVLIFRLDGTFLRAFFAGAAIWLLLLPKVQDNPFIYFRF
jgi:D-alanyl-lipoteichoic acid acyltransferase DltB (MBOAT superfamily)